MRTVYVGFLLFVLFSCHLRQPLSNALATGISDSLSSRIKGVYNGHLKDGLVTLVINYISDSTVSGFDLHRGLRRNVNGIVQQDGGAVRIMMKEPGNNPGDGTFYMSMDTASRSITGRWVPQDSAKIHSGPLDLKRWDRDTGVNFVEEIPWHGERGTLYFTKNGTCELDLSEHTIWGIYEQKGKTIFIEWEPNNKLPARRMKLVRKGYTADDQDSGPPTLQGDGMKFEESQAG